MREKISQRQRRAVQPPAEGLNDRKIRIKATAATFPPILPLPFFPVALGGSMQSVWPRIGPRNERGSSSKTSDGEEDTRRGTREKNRWSRANGAPISRDIPTRSSRWEMTRTRDRKIFIEGGAAPRRKKTMGKSSPWQNGAAIPFPWLFLVPLFQSARGIHWKNGD